MATPQLDIYLPDGSVQNFPLLDERVVVGTSTKCQVMLDRPELSAEHLLVSPRPEGCWVAVARGVVTPTLVDGQPFERGMVQWGHNIQIGSVRMVLNDGTRAAATKGGKTEKKEEKVSPVLLIVAVIVLGFAGYSLLSPPGGQEAPERPRTPPPPLFDETARPCSQSAPNLLTAAAEENTRIANAKAERLPFSMQDGVDAVNYFAQAAACYRAAGDQPAANEAGLRGARLRNRLEDEYRAHQFRLERALEQARIEDALYETRMLRAMVAHRRGPYLTALTTLERQLTLKIDQAVTAPR